MSKVEQIEAEIAELSPAEARQVAKWLENYSPMNGIGKSRSMPKLVSWTGLSRKHWKSIGKAKPPPPNPETSVS